MSPIWPSFLITFILLTILQIISAKKITQATSSVIYGLTHSHHLTVAILAIIFLPGTIIHELSHLLTAKMLFVHTGQVDVLPDFTANEEQIKLGSAEIGQTDPIRRSIIGIAPIIIGITLIVILVWLFGGSLDFRTANWVWWQALLLLYLTFTIGNTFVSSRKDLEGVGGVAVTLISATIISLSLLYLFGQLNQSILTQIYQKIYTNQTQTIFYRATLAMLIPLLINLSILGAVKIFKK